MHQSASTMAPTAGTTPGGASAPRQGHVPRGRTFFFFFFDDGGEMPNAYPGSRGRTRGYVGLAPTKTPPGVLTWPGSRSSQERVQHTSGSPSGQSAYCRLLFPPGVDVTPSGAWHHRLYSGAGGDTTPCARHPGWCWGAGVGNHGPRRDPQPPKGRQSEVWRPSCFSAARGSLAAHPPRAAVQDCRPGRAFDAAGGS